MSPRHTRYDMIFLGGGCAALSLLVRLVRSGVFTNYRFLVIDRDNKKSNDRTWCFWEKGTGYFEEVLYSTWDQLDFFSPDYSSSLGLDGYRYKMIRGADFYSYCLHILQHSNQVEWVEASVTDVTRQQEQLIVQGNTGTGDLFSWALTAPLVFNSIYRTAATSRKQVDLLQHFKGWVIEIPESSSEGFDPARATLMDFRVSQQEGTTFVYVMPFSKRRALVEYTLFTGSLLSPEAYEKGLRDYIDMYLGVKEYHIVEEEFGVIPMTSRSFSFYQEGLFNLGTAGGQTKASSGYTFQFIQKQSEQFLGCLVQATSMGRGLNSHDRSVISPLLQSLRGDSRRFHFYDQVLLQVLSKGYWPGHKVFARLFQKNKAAQIFRFLDNETSVGEELSIISSLPTWPFLKAAIATR
ncbi:MAG: lycopene cyclase family protein [Sphingomonadales bacterium]